MVSTQTIVENQGAIDVTSNYSVIHRTTHIDICFHVAREGMRERKIFFCIGQQNV